MLETKKPAFQTALEYTSDMPLDEKMEFLMKQNAQILRELHRMNAMLRMEISDGR